jgi:hypothetical protein
MDTERLAQFQELVALDPHDTVVRFGLGELYLQAQEFAQAAEQFAEIIRSINAMGLEAFDRRDVSIPRRYSQATPCRTRAARLVRRCMDRTFRTAIARALGCPITTTNCLPRVTPV